ncbi:predicted protein [Chaetoceros tenuissimus]|uniref:Uncharacterized protein n=1 Tax=Chaetoceros tenuissimus TaxID=426638 RepID=A0AAD3CSQ7_9STRA|nr:predicted protein [Chaetoceros tenuissimus]
MIARSLFRPGAKNILILKRDLAAGVGRREPSTIKNVRKVVEQKKNDKSRQPKSKQDDNNMVEDSSYLNAPRSRGRDDDSLSRFPNLNSPGGILRMLDYGGTIEQSQRHRVV